MNHFQMRSYPYHQGGGGGLSTNNFHPRWKEALPQLVSETFQRTMETYVEKVSRWSRIHIGLEFNLDKGGLYTINIPTDGSLYLDRVKEEHISHNLQSAIVVGAVAAVMTEYLYYMKFVIERLED